MSDWKQVELGKLFESISERFVPRNPEGVYFLNTSDVLEGKVSAVDITPFEGLPGQAKKAIQRHDILYSEIRPANKRYGLVDFEASNHVVSTKLMVLRKITDDSLKYLLLSITNEQFLRELQLIAEGRSGSFPQITFDVFKKLEITLPPLVQQEAIAEVLSSLDDKIDLLKRQNKTLESMAEALFRQWFIEEAQDDWEVCTFGDFFPVKTGKKDANYSTEDGPYPFFTCSQEVSKSPDYSFNGKAILLAGNGNFNVKRYNGKFEAYQRTYVLIPEDPSLHAWLFFHLRFALQKIVMGSRGSVISFLTKGLIQNHEFTKPPELEKQKLDELDKLLEATDANDAQIKNLTLQRDTLLPKLMSGEVRVQMD